MPTEPVVAGRPAKTASTPAHLHRFTPRRASAAVAGIGLVVGVGVAAASQSASAGQDFVGAGQITKSLIVSDEYNRTVAVGLGATAPGGGYTTAYRAPASVQVGSGAAIYRGLAPGTAATASLGGISVENVEVSTALAVSSVTAPGTYHALDLRRQASGATYRAKIKISPGVLGLRIARISAGVETTVASRDLAVGVASGASVNVSAQVISNSPVVVSLKAWKTGGSEPAWQLAYRDASSAAIKSAGAIGVWHYVSSGAPSTNLFMPFLRAWSLGWAPATATAPSKTTTPAKTTAPSKTTAPAKTTTPSKTTAPTKTTTTTKTTAPTTKSGPTASTTTPSPPVTPKPATTAATKSGRGSAAVGATAYVIPSGALFVSPSGSDSAAGTQAAPLRTTQAAVNRAAPGKTIVLRRGTYHEQVSVPANKTGITIQSYPNEAVWFDGSSVMTGWTKGGSTWVRSGWTKQFVHNASFNRGVDQSSVFINPAYPMAAWPEQVFVAGKQLAQVSSSAAVGSGKFSVNYAAKTLTIGTNPAGAEIRASDIEQAFNVLARNVTLQGFGVRRYGTPLPSLGTVRLTAGSDTARSLVITDNASQGLSFRNSNNTADHVTSTSNGLAGIHGNEADGLKITNSIISGNNSEHFNPQPASAGIKVTRTKGVTISNNDLMDNNGNSVWLDESVRNFTVVSNHIVRSANDGISVELSDTGIIANNSIEHMQFGVMILDTGNVKVFNNHFEQASKSAVGLTQDQRRQAAAGAVGRDPRMPVPDPSCPWLVRNIVVSNNDFGATSSGNYHFSALDKRTNIPADKMNITINGNQFAPRIRTTDPVMVGWGQSNNSSYVRYETPAALAAAKNPHWVNLLGATATSSASVAVNSIAVPLPSDVAAAIAVPPGTKRVGAF